MSVQVAVVLGVAVVTAAVIAVLRLRPVLQPRRVTDTGLDSGVYLLTSHGCDSCDTARSKLTRRGTDFVEIAWQDRPDVFERSGVDAVPSVLAVAAGGSGRWWRGGVPLVGLGSRVSRQIPGAGGETG